MPAAAGIGATHPVRLCPRNSPIRVFRQSSRIHHNFVVLSFAANGGVATTCGAAGGEGTASPEANQEVGHPHSVVDISDSDYDGVELWKSGEFHASDSDLDASSDRGLDLAWGKGYGEEGILQSDGRHLVLKA